MSERILHRLIRAYSRAGRGATELTLINATHLDLNFMNGNIQILLIEQAKTLGITDPVTQRVRVSQAWTLEDELLRLRSAGIQSAVVAIHPDGHPSDRRVQLWRAPADKPVPLYRDYADAGMGPRGQFKGRNAQTNLNHAS